MPDPPQGEQPTQPDRSSGGSRLAAAATMLRLAWAADRKRSVLAFGLFGLQAVAGSLFAWWLKLLLDAVDTRDGADLALAVIGLAVSLAGTTVLARAGAQVVQTLREGAHNLVERRLIELVGGTPTLEIHETPEHLTQLEVLEHESWQFGDTVPSLINLFATAVRILTTVVLLVSVTPLLLLVPLFGLPTLLLSAKTSHLYHVGHDRAAEALRRSGVLYGLATNARFGPEVRLFRLGAELMRRFHADYHELISVFQRVAIQAESIGLATRLFFLLGYFGAIVLVVNQAVNGQATAGDVALTAVLAGQVLGLIGGSAELLQFAWRNLATASRYVKLQTVSQQARARTSPTPGTIPATVPTSLTDGVRLDHVSFRYPHAPRDALHNLDVHLPAGSTIAVVGDNGAGKTTLVKLLARFYPPPRARSASTAPTSPPSTPTNGANDSRPASKTTRDSSSSSAKLSESVTSPPLTTRPPSGQPPTGPERATSSTRSPKDSTPNSDPNGTTASTSPEANGRKSPSAAP